MSEYLYNRKKITSGDFLGCWAVENPDRRDEFNKQIYLCNEIKDLLGLSCKMFCSNIQIRFVFENELTLEQKNRLDLIVSNHQNNVNF